MARGSVSRVHRLPLIALLALAAAALVAPGAAQANGTCGLGVAQGVAGTVADPIRIATVADFEAFATDAGCFFATDDVFLQTADLDFGGERRLAVGSVAAPLRATYDGGGHAIRGLVVDAGDPQGLFASTDGATIRNLVLIGPRVTSIDNAAGALVGTLNDSTIASVTVQGAQVSSGGGVGAGGLVGAIGSGTSTISDVATSGTVTATGYAPTAPAAPLGAAGGVLGSVCGGITLARASSSAAVTASGTAGAAGGLVGSTGYCFLSRRGHARTPVARVPYIPTTITDAHATGAVRSTGYAGGFGGLLGSLSITRSSATGTVTGATAGGFAGHLATGTVRDVYATGAVTATDLAGGLAAEQSQLELANAYASGATSGANGAGGLIQRTAVAAGSVLVESVTASFWDTQSTGQATSLFGVGKTTAEMRDSGTFSAAGWTIASGWSAASGRVWGICPTVNGGRPFLVSQYTADPCAALPGKPGSLTVTSGNGRVRVSWTAPASDGGSPITAYTVVAQMQPQGKAVRPSCTATPPKTSCTLTGLRNGRRYRVSVTAESLAGTGAAAKAFVTPRALLTVVSTQRSGLQVVTRVRVNSPGALTQVGRPAGAGGVACRAARTQVRHAGFATLRCALTADAIRMLEDGALRLRLVTRFTPTTGAAASVTRNVTFPRTTGVPVVTG